MFITHLVTLRKIMLHFQVGNYTELVLLKRDIYMDLRSPRSTDRPSFFEPLGIRGTKQHSKEIKENRCKKIEENEKSAHGKLLKKIENFLNQEDEKLSHAQPFSVNFETMQITSRLLSYAKNKDDANFLNGLRKYGLIIIKKPVSISINSHTREQFFHVVKISPDANFKMLNDSFDEVEHAISVRDQIRNVTNPSKNSY